MQQVKLHVIQNVPLTDTVRKMTLAGDVSAITRPGQFINIALDGLYLRRPLSVADLAENAVTVIYRIVGKGTEALSRMGPGDTVDVLTGLGNGFDLSCSGPSPLLVGGGIGTPPMFYLARALLEQGVRPTVLLGFNTASEVILLREFSTLGVKVFVTTVDGTAGRQGFVTGLMDQQDYSYFYACGPEPMLRAVHEASKTEGELSFEERMGCGFGACMGCSCKTRYGAMRICVDGPVLKKEAVIW